MKLTWDDAEQTAAALAEHHPDVDVLGVHFTDLHRWVVELPGFADDPKGSSEANSRPSRWRGWRKFSPVEDGVRSRGTFLGNHLLP